MVSGDLANNQKKGFCSPIVGCLFVGSVPFSTLKMTKNWLNLRILPTD
jgi:hypothetical protein